MQSSGRSGIKLYPPALSLTLSVPCYLSLEILTCQKARPVEFPSILPALGSDVSKCFMFLD